MSVQFGRWNFDGKPVDRDYLEKAKACIAPYGPDDAGSYSRGNISILYRAFHTTKESRREMQPHVTSSDAILTWDGRLDNRADLVRQLRDVLTISSTDVEIVALADPRQRPHRHAPSLLLIRRQPGHLEHDPRPARLVRGESVHALRRVHRRLVLVLSGCSFDALRGDPFRSPVLFGAAPTGKAYRSQILEF